MGVCNPISDGFNIFFIFSREETIKRSYINAKKKDAEQMRTAEAPGQKIKKGISEKTSRAVHPPGIRRIRKTFPPENVPRPPLPANPNADICGPFILPGIPPIP